MEEYQAELLQRPQPSPTKRTRILDEHAEYLAALTDIDTSLEYIYSKYHSMRELYVILDKMRAAIPESIKETRKGHP